MTTGPGLTTGAGVDYWLCRTRLSTCGTFTKPGPLTEYAKHPGMPRHAMMAVALGEPPMAAGGPPGIPHVLVYGFPGWMYWLQADAAPAPKNMLVAAARVPMPRVSADPLANIIRRDLC